MRMCHMTQLVLTNEQAETLAQSTEPVVFVDQQGRLLGFLVQSEFTSEDLAEAKRRLESPGPWRTTAEVLGKLQARRAS